MSLIDKIQMKKMAILFLIIGIASLAISTYFFTRKENTTAVIPARPETSLETLHKKDSSKRDVFNANKEKGNAFEDYMIQLLGKEKGVQLVSRNSDYHKNGVSASENMEPDLKFKLNNVRFSVECKWRKSFFNQEVSFAKNYQIRNYNKYQIDTNQKVFVAFGIGGNPSSPEKLFLLPLAKLTEQYISEHEIKDYEVKTADEIMKIIDK